MSTFAVIASCLSVVLSLAALVLLRRLVLLLEDNNARVAEAFETLGIIEDLATEESWATDAVGPTGLLVHEDDENAEMFLRDAAQPPKEVIEVEEYEIARALWIACGRQGPPPAHPFATVPSDEGP